MGKLLHRVLVLNSVRLDEHQISKAPGGMYIQPSSPQCTVTLQCNHFQVLVPLDVNVNIVGSGPEVFLSSGVLV